MTISKHENKSDFYIVFSTNIAFYTIIPFGKIYKQRKTK